MMEDSRKTNTTLLDDDLEKVSGGNNSWSDNFSEDGSCPNCGDN